MPCVACVLAGVFPNVSASDAPPEAASSRPLLAQQELDALLARIERDLGGLKSLQTNFTQEKHLAIFAAPVKAQGILLFQRPKDIRFEIRAPFRSVLIAHDQAVAKYEFMDGKWLKLAPPMSDSILVVTGQLASWLQGRLREANKVYHIAATAEPEPTIILTPIQQKLKEFIAAIDLKMAYAPTRVVSLVIREPNGDYTTVSFSNEERDKPLPASYFDTVPGEPVEVDVAAAAPATESGAGK
jgi:outer membrane lipoprotein-sorting protein